MFRIQLFFPVDAPAALRRFSTGDEIVASVYERPDGWKIDLYQSLRGLDLDGFLGAIASAKECFERIPEPAG